MLEFVICLDARRPVTAFDVLFALGEGVAHALQVEGRRGGAVGVPLRRRWLRGGGTRYHHYGTVWINHLVLRERQRERERGGRGGREGYVRDRGEIRKVER